jgi:hypothetical protein
MDNWLCIQSASDGLSLRWQICRPSFDQTQEFRSNLPVYLRLAHKVTYTETLKRNLILLVDL